MVVVVEGGGSVGVTCSCVPRRGGTPGSSITSGTTVVVGAAVVGAAVVVESACATGGGVDASAAVANAIAAEAAIMTTAATRPNFVRIGGMLVDTCAHDAASSTRQSNASPSTTSMAAIDPVSSRSAVPARNAGSAAAGSVTA